MTEPRFFARQLATYAAYHRDARNRLTHFAGIPAIIFSIMLALALARFSFVGWDLSLGIVVSAAAFVLWIALDVGVGTALTLVLLPLLILAESLARAASETTVWWLFGVLFVGGWALQFLGHAYEGRRPALLENLFQALIGPMFLIAEVFIAMGRRPDLVVNLAPATDGPPAT